MKDCATYAPWLGARPGELSASEEERLHEHLATCEACQGRLADLQATTGMLEEALSRTASRRDFTTFADEVMTRIPASAWKSDARPRGVFGTLKAFFGRHRAIAIASAIAPALAAAALYLFIDRSGTPETVPPGVEVVSETLAPVVLDTSDGPVVLVSESDGT